MCVFVCMHVCRYVCVVLFFIMSAAHPLHGICMRAHILDCSHNGIGLSHVCVPQVLTPEHAELKAVAHDYALLEVAKYDKLLETKKAVTSQQEHDAAVTTFVERVAERAKQRIEATAALDRVAGAGCLPTDL
jgi:hypothetical protein